MKKLLLSVAIATIAAAAITAQNTESNDPVVMTVAGRPVYLSEFEYLYNKNNSQQLVPLTFDEYVDMFVNYKLKVADALNEGIDTTGAYRTEITKFRRDLAQPYLNDTVVAEALIAEAYSHTGEDVYVSHIMLSAQDPANADRLDSIRSLILNGTITFEDAAKANSIDRRSSVEGGRMGWVTGAGMYPWPFEKAAYDTPVGQMSPVINSGVGYHIVRPEMRRPAAGEVECEHILIFTRGKDEAGTAAAKAKIDSIYTVVTTEGVNFGDVAKRESEDRGSAQNGGKLGWFGAGMMVPEFETVAFSLNDGEISEPFTTTYGYHIVHKLGHRGPGSLEEQRPTIQQQISNDPMRRDAPFRAKIHSTAQRVGASLNLGYEAIIDSTMTRCLGKLDPRGIDELKGSDFVIFTINGKPYTLGEIASSVPLREDAESAEVKFVIDRGVQNTFDNAIVDVEIDELYATVPSYRNLLNEYTDGILLFDVSKQKIWDKAASDPKALQKFFKKNKKNYTTWTEPRYKAYVIFAANDSIAQEVENFCNTNFGKRDITKIDQEAFTNAIKEAFGGQVKVQRVIAKKGENDITDYLGFGADKPESNSRNFSSYFAFAGKIVNQPEEYIDVKGQVLTDYQNQLEAAWLKALRKAYPVVINRANLELAK